MKHLTNYRKHIRNTMKKTKFFKPYQNIITKKAPNGKQIVTRGKCTLQKTGPGVYIIKEAGKIVYIGYASRDVKGVMYRHFQRWTDRRHPDEKRTSVIERVTYKEPGETFDSYRVRVVFCRSAQQAATLEEALIRKYKPRNNAGKYAVYSLFKHSTAVEKYEDAPETNEFLIAPF